MNSTEQIGVKQKRPESFNLLRFTSVKHLKTFKAISKSHADLMDMIPPFWLGVLFLISETLSIQHVEVVWGLVLCTNTPTQNSCICIERCYATNTLFTFRRCVNPESSMNSVNSVRLWMDGCTAAFIGRLWLKHTNENAPNVFWSHMRALVSKLHRDPQTSKHEHGCNNMRLNCRGG